MSPTTGYREVDFDHDKLEKTTSWPDGLHEAFRFQPYLPRAVRRTDSTDHIERFKDHFSLIEKKQGNYITWKQYLNILLEDLRKFDIHRTRRKVMLKNWNSPASSETSNYVTASEPETFKNKAFEAEIKKKMFFKREIGSDTESISSTDTANMMNSVPVTPQRGILKKMVNEIRRLAENTCKSVDRMTAKSGRCFTCKSYLGVNNDYKRCHHTFVVDLFNCKEPLTPSMFRRTNLAGVSPMSFDSPMKSANGSSKCSVNPHSNKLTTPRAIKRMEPFIKISPRRGN